MRKIHIYQIIVLFLISFTGFSQESTPFFKDYTWEENPSYTPGKEDQDIIAAKNKIVTEFFFEGQNFVEYFLEHKVVWLNSDDQIEKYNKVYLPYSQSSNLEINRARVIKSDGSVQELDKSKVLTATDEETGRTYKYFAFEGVEKGSFIEYYYVVKRNPSYQGKRLSFQSTYEKNNIEFDLFSPSNLLFKFKSYNGLAEVTKDTTTTEKQHWKLRMNRLSGINRESQAPFNASRGSVVYKLDRNTANPGSKITSYAKAAQNIYNYYHKDYSDKVKKQLRAFMSNIDLKDTEDEVLKIRKIDSYIKQNIYLSETGNESLADLESVLKSKVANETGVVKLYASIFNELGIKHEIVITTDRLEQKFDKNFESLNFLRELLFYMPKSKMYLCPGKFETRFEFPPAYFTDNYGLFIKEVKIGSYKSGVGKVKYIKAVEAQKSIDKMIVDVAFDKDDLTINNIRLHKFMSGYYAMYIQPFTNLIEGEKRKELIEGFAKNLDQVAEVESAKMLNDDPNLFGIKPLELDIKFTSEAFVEKAGKKYLFKLGQIIGPQMEMYQEKKRVLPLESEFNRGYVRTINVTIPEGYKIVNLDDINIDNSYSEDNKEFFSFKSFYSLKGNVLKITADEHYHKTIVPPSLYEEYRKVINSAADFNKITLVLEPK